jgi:hypothetical protein
VLRRECELRLSEETLSELAATLPAARTLADHTAVIDALQARVVREFGIADTPRGVELLRSCVSRYPDDSDFAEIPFYVRYNTCWEGDLAAGSPAPRATVHDADSGARMDLLDLVPPRAPLALVFGSWT